MKVKPSFTLHQLTLNSCSVMAKLLGPLRVLMNHFMFHL
jgi:hypothetical protein